MKFNEILAKVNSQLNGLINKETPQETIEEIQTIKASVEELQTSHEELAKSYGSMKDKYIEVITKTGSAAKPQDEDKTPRTMEEIAKSIVARDKKGEKK